VEVLSLFSLGFWHQGLLGHGFRDTRHGFFLTFELFLSVSVANIPYPVLSLQTHSSGSVVFPYKNSMNSL
jgi:hypothetical protein